MKMTFTLLALNAFSICCSVGAILLAINNIPGWGWFLFVGLISITEWSGVKNEEVKK